MPSVITRDDGFFGLTGFPPEVYFATVREALRVAAQVDAAAVGPTPTDVGQDATISSLYQGLTTTNMHAQDAQAAADAAETHAQTVAADLQAANAAIQVQIADLLTLATDLGARLEPLFLYERFKARFAACHPDAFPPPMWEYSDLDFRDNTVGGAPTNQYMLSGGASVSQDHGTSVVLAGGGPGTNNALFNYQSVCLAAQRQRSWHLGGGVYFMGPVGVGSGEWRYIGFANHSDVPNIRGKMMGVGLFEDVSPAFFSFRTADNGTAPLVKTALSTIPYSAGFHVLELWFDRTQGAQHEEGTDRGTLFGSIDFEAPVPITDESNTYIPAGGLSQWHANIDGTQDMQIDALGICSERWPT